MFLCEREEKERGVELGFRCHVGSCCFSRSFTKSSVWVLEKHFFCLAFITTLLVSVN